MPVTVRDQLGGRIPPGWTPAPFGPRSRPPTLKDKLMSRYSPKNILEQEPAVISGAVIVAVNALALFGVVAVSAEQLAGLNAGLAALLALFTRQTVTPTAKVR